MKKLLFILLLFVPIFGFAQNDNIRIETLKLTDFMYNDASGNVDTLIAVNQDSIGQFLIMNVSDPESALDAVNYRTLQDYGDSGGIDSLKWNPGNGIAAIYVGANIIASDTLDDRYVELSDSTSLWVTISQLQDSLNQLESQINAQENVYRITLPVNGTLSGSASAATDLPTGWSLSVSGGDLQINHGLGRYSSAVNIRYNTSGISYRQLRNFDNAYSGILDVDSNNLTIESISTFYTAYELRITIIFE